VTVRRKVGVLSVPTSEPWTTGLFAFLLRQHQSFVGIARAATLHLLTRLQNAFSAAVSEIVRTKADLSMVKVPSA
jgi:hypothetical protein